MKKLAALILAGCALPAVQAQSAAEKPAYVRLTAVRPMGDLYAYLGQKPLATAFEFGYDFSGPDDLAGLGVYVTRLQASGQAMDKYQGLTQTLNAWRLGGDVRFKTPVQGLTPYLGLSLSFYEGKRTTGGVVPNFDTPATPWIVAPGDYPEKNKAKFGGRLGVEYRFNAAWGMSVDYNFSEWKSEYRLGTFTPITGHRHTDGINPINPSWIGVSAQYRWSFSK